jgi:cytoskeletal protein CcmA (bactofilin family)
MAMFDKHKSAKHTAPASQESRVPPAAPAISPGASVSANKVAMIGHGISISGDVKADTSLKIEGRLEGRSVQCTDEVEIGERGQVKANILAKVVKVSGMVSGDIGGSEKVLITRTGRVQGNIVAPRVQLEDGALFRGSIDMNPAQPVSKEQPAVAKQPAGKLDAPASSQAAAAAPSSPAKSQSAVPDSARKEPSLNLKRG